MEHRPKPKLVFESLGDRHLIDAAQLDTCSNAARVRLDAHHTAPTEFQIESRGEAQPVDLGWTPSDNLLKRSYLNEEDAKRDGAYAIALAAVEQLENMVGVARCETKTAPITTSCLSEVTLITIWRTGIGLRCQAPIVKSVKFATG